MSHKQVPKEPPADDIVGIVAQSIRCVNSDRCSVWQMERVHTCEECRLVAQNAINAVLTGKVQ